MKQDCDGAFKQLFQEALNTIMKSESETQLGAAPYERSDKRSDSRNGFRERKLTTRLGTLTLNVPRHRNVPFKTLIFNNYSRSEAALIATMGEMVVNGVSTRKVTNVFEKLCGTKISKSAVSEACKELSASVDKFKNRPIEKNYPFVTIDATYFKVREEFRVISKALMIAYAIDDEGIQDIIGFEVYENESMETWTDFLQMLKDRGLKDPLMFTSDAYNGIINAIREVYPGVPWQRCQFHFTKNISDKAPKKYQKEIQAEMRKMYNCDTIEEAREKCSKIVSNYRDVAEKAMNTLEQGFEAAMAVMVLPKNMRVLVRTSNRLERINKELKHRSKVIGIFPNRDSLLRLMGSVLINQDENLKNRRALFSNRRYQRLMASGIKEELAIKAEEQANFLIAA